jgi:hypothetical protein
LAEDRIGNKAIVPTRVYCRQRRAAAALWVQRALKEIIRNLYGVLSLAESGRQEEE